nr:MAG TPA: hypothetical protein [Caudoviricetes sp.]
MRACFFVYIAGRRKKYSSVIKELMRSKNNTFRYFAILKTGANVSENHIRK